MSGKYYYLVASLPYLDIDKKAPITYENFVSECEKWLIRDELTQLKRADIDDYHATDEDAYIIKQWKAFEINLRLELARARRLRKNSPKEQIPEFFKNVFDQPNPLLMEKELAKMRWRFLSQDESGYLFDVNALIIYALKLQLIEKIERYDKQKGNAVFAKATAVNY